MSNQPIRVLIADDHPVFRFGLRALLESQPDMLVVAEAASGEEAVELAQSLQPDVVLMDVTMTGMNGIEATRQISTELDGTAILIITMFDDDTVFTAMQAGARGYLLKGAQGDETLRAIRAVANGEIIFSPGVAEQMMSLFCAGNESCPRCAFPRPDAARRGNSGTAGPGVNQRGHRRKTGPESENDPQSGLQCLQQAPGGHAQRGDHQSPRGGPGPRRVLMAASRKSIL